jgi:hypothetical protein
MSSPLFNLHAPFYDTIYPNSHPRPILITESIDDRPKRPIPAEPPTTPSNPVMTSAATAAGRDPTLPRFTAREPGDDSDLDEYMSDLESIHRRPDLPWSLPSSRESSPGRPPSPSRELRDLMARERARERRNVHRFGERVAEGGLARNPVRPPPPPSAVEGGRGRGRARAAAAASAWGWNEFDGGAAPRLRAASPRSRGGGGASSSPPPPCPRPRLAPRRMERSPTPGFSIGGSVAAARSAAAAALLAPPAEEAWARGMGTRGLSFRPREERSRREDGLDMLAAAAGLNIVTGRGANGPEESVGARGLFGPAAAVDDGSGYEGDDDGGEDRGRMGSHDVLLEN